MLKKVLVPLDGFKPSAAILPYVGALRKAFDAQVTLVSVVEPWRYSINPELQVNIDQVLSAAQMASRDYLRAKSKELKNAVIVMSTHGHTGSGHWFLGSVAEAVVRQSGSPVLLTRPL